MLLTDDLLLDYKRCQRRAFLNVYGDSIEEDPERDFLLKLRQESQNHIANVIDEFYPVYHQPQAPDEDWEARAKETEALMQQGVECIYQGVLLQEDFTIERGGVTLVSNPSLLVKQPGMSHFGDWMYLPIGIRFGRRPKPEYKIVAAFHAYLLAGIQGVLPETSQIILRRQNSYAVNLENWIPRMQDVLSECVQMLLVHEKPEVFISRQRCSLCHWHSHCYAIAQSQKHLSLVPGVTPNRYEHLQALGVETVESLAAACPINMGEAIGVEIASGLKQQAQSILQNRAMLKPDRVSGRHRAIPTASIELYFDIEAEPERNLDYLLGVLVVERQANTEQFYPFLAENPEDEGSIWEQFLALVRVYHDAPIFHFSEYEVETIKRLAKLYNTPRKQIKPLLSRFVDLHQWVITSVTLPVENYSLKSLAHWLGFQWRDRGVSGAQSVCWYDRWLKTGDRALLSAILRYNEDDCRATRHLKDWLVEFLLEGYPLKPGQ
ncbi:MAG: TM0106 family RecB-like putative nuclease [Xenococcaceae cyanobacterium]